jgi:hypothetical protein
MAFPPLRHNGDRVFGRLPDLFQHSDNPHIPFCEFFFPALIPGRFISQEERNVFGVRAQEESFLAASLDIAQHPHAAIDGFIAIADGAKSDDVRRAVRWLTFNRRTVIDKTCC